MQESKSESKDLTESKTDTKTCSPKIEVTTPDEKSLTESKKESTKYSSSDEEESDDDEYRDMEGRTRTAAGVEVRLFSFFSLYPYIFFVYMSRFCQVSGELKTPPFSPVKILRFD